MLKQIFLALFLKYRTNLDAAELAWKEIEQNYSDKKRHYHNLLHLENLFRQLSSVKSEIKDWDTILFSMFYHDIVYNTSNNNNEEKSAELAKKRLSVIGLPENKVAACVAQILATKGHTVSEDPDTDIFTDADLSVLGTDWEKYAVYYKQIRQEYSLYPDFMYVPGRKKVLKHFLNMDRIFKIDYFYNKFESAARENLTNELKTI